MKNKIKNLFCVIGIFLVFGSVVIAGSLSPSSSPIPSTHTLSDIYNKLINNLYTANILNSFDFPTGEASSTMHTVEEIWNAIPNISSSTVISGNTILGIAGAYNVSNLTADKVASGTSYGINSVGIAQIGFTLQWSETIGPMKWASSTAYCSRYGYGTSTSSGFSTNGLSWRLPTAREMNLNEDVLDDTPATYWTSSEKITSLSNLTSGMVWVAIVDEWGMGFLGKSSGSSYYFKCVRNS